MTEPTPKFVLDYIQFLKKFYAAFPTETALRFNLPEGTIPNFNLEPYFASDRGWAVLHRDPVTGRNYLTEFVEPPLAQDSALPPLEFDPGIPIVVPQYAPPEGYFVLIVENEGLPRGYAATTSVNVRTLANSLGVANGGAGFNVPFRGQYELPVKGRLAVAAGNPEEQLRYDFGYSGRVKTLNGEYEAQGPFYSIFPKSGELHRVKIRWAKVDPFVPPPPPAPPPKPPVQLPPVPPPNPQPPFTPPTAPPRTGQVGIVAVQTQPIFYPSTTPRRPQPLPQLPSSVRLKEPFRDPEGTFRATSVQQMFSFTPEPTGRSIIYSIGVRPDNIRPTVYRIRNNTVNATLQFNFTVPSFLFLDVPIQMLLEPQQETLVTVSFNENDARAKSLTTTRNYAELFDWEVKPVNVTGPVYVRRNLPTLAYSQPGETVPPQAPNLQISAPLVGQIGGNTGANLDLYTTLYFAFDTPRVTMIRGERRGIKVDAWIGGVDVSPLSPGAIPLQFEPNSILWEVSNPSIMEVEGINGSNNATLVAIAPGISEFKAKIVKPPINVIKNRWDLIYNTKTEIRGGGRRALFPNSVSGIEIVGVNNIYTSTSQTSQR